MRSGYLRVFLKKENVQFGISLEMRNDYLIVFLKKRESTTELHGKAINSRKMEEAYMLKDS
jgi:hypothetical protein